MNRRDLLRSAGAGLIASVRGRAAGPSVIRAGLLGTQHSHTTGKLKAMQDSPDYEVVGIAENDPEAKTRAQKDPRFQGLRWTGEAELLKDPSIHLIVVECVSRRL
jgi:predicted dehydrogenase